MAGTDSSRPPHPALASEPQAAPAFILVRPQLAENMGAAARAMLNCALDRLTLVAPRDSHLDEKAIAAASGAERVLKAAVVHAGLEEAVGGLARVYATSARRRDMVKPVMTPRLAVREMRALAARGQRVGVLFGPERTGLTNDDLALADVIVEAPLNPGFRSLNLAQAVLLVAYEWLQAADDQAALAAELPLNGAMPADKAQLLNFFAHLERELDACGFLRVREKRPIMVRNIRTLFTRANLTDQEVRTLHGVVAELVKGPRDERGEGG